MPNEIVVGAQVLGYPEVLVAALTTWHPFVDVYVDGTANAFAPGSGWNLYAVTNTGGVVTRTRIASGLFNTSTPQLGQRVISKALGAGDTIELWGTSILGNTGGAIQAAIVGWDPSTATPNAEDSQTINHANIVPADGLVVGAAIPWHPNVSAFVQAGAQALNARCEIRAVIGGGFAVNVPVAVDLFGDQLPSRFVTSAEGGCASWQLLVGATGGPTGSINTALSGFSPPGSGAGGSDIPTNAAQIFVWRPGGVAGKGVYTTPAALAAAVSAVNGYRKILVDTSLGAAAIAASIDFTGGGAVVGDVEFAAVNGAVPFAGQTTVVVTGATIITGLTRLTNVVLDNSSTAYLIPIVPNGQFVLREGASIINRLGALLFNLAAGQHYLLYLLEGSSVFAAGGGTNAIAVAGGAAIFEVFMAGGNAAQGTEGAFAANQIAFTAGGFVIFCQLDGGQFTIGAQAGVTPIFRGGRQFGTATIDGATGKSQVITAVINATSRILVSLKTPGNDANTVKYAALSSLRTVASAGVLGTFQVAALTAVGGGDLNTADTSVLDWEIDN